MSDAPKAFAVEAAEGVDVHIDDSSEDETFKLTVLKQGQQVEEHAGLTADTVGSVGSEHFSVATVDPPAAPSDPSDDDAPQGDPPQEG